MLVSDPTVVNRAIDLGVNFFDTARDYQKGNNGRRVGAVLEGRRNMVILVSKTTAKTREQALVDLDTNLKEVGTDYLDIWRLHSKNKPEEVTDELLEAQRIAKQAGKIRFAGVSLHPVSKDFIPTLVKRGQTDVILTAYNFAMPLEMEMQESIRAARQAGVGIIAMKVMAGGVSRLRTIGGKIGNIDTKATSDRPRNAGGMMAASRWAPRNQRVDTAIVGMLDADQLAENFAAASQPFTEDDRKKLTARLEEIRPLYCRMCGSCDGECRRGLSVPDMLRIRTYADGCGNFPLARQRFQELPPEAAGVRCGDCSHCTVRCPNGVRVRERLTLAQEILA
jgi:predicted aldo/keto reductase-like oxidoreductase